MNARKVEEYLQLPYTIEITRDANEENPGWVARVVELPGCFTQSDTFEELQAMIEDAMRLWIGTAIEDGLPVPEPRDVEGFSGKFIVRVPKSLHRQLVERAGQEGISLNQFVNTVLAGAVGFPMKTPQAAPPVFQQEFRELISKTVKEVLREIGTPVQEKRLEAVHQISSGELLFSSKVAVFEQLGIDYQRWMEEAGREPLTRELRSSMLDSLVGEAEDKNDGSIE